MSFSSMQLHAAIAAGIEAAGYRTPTPIQARAIPVVLQGRDVLGLAQTGTGKTAAFAVPILQRLLAGPRGRLRALVLAPTRELAEQIHTSFTELGRRTDLRSTSIYGGVGVTPQVRRLRAGVEIAVACPGRLLDHMAQRTVDLSGVEVLVIDEADRMFDMGFLPGLRKIVAALPARRQTLMFSATMPDDIRRLAHEVLHGAATVQVDRAAPAATVAHAFYPVPQHLKTALLFELLRRTETGSVLVFTRTKHRARRVGQQLEKSGYRAASLQGNLSQNRRQAVLEGFRDGSHRILVATDIAARGIDVSSISHVINYDMPDVTDAYIHRIGRTGRAAKNGEAYTFLTPDDEPLARGIERVLGSRVERRRVEGFDYARPAPARDTEFARGPRQPQGKRRAPQPSRTGSPDRGAAGDGAPGTGGDRPQRPAARGANGRAGGRPQHAAAHGAPAARAARPERGANPSAVAPAERRGRAAPSRRPRPERGTSPGAAPGDGRHGRAAPTARRGTPASHAPRPDRGTDRNATGRYGRAHAAKKRAGRRR